MQRFIKKLQHALSGDFDKESISKNGVAYATLIDSECGVLKCCIEHMDGTVIVPHPGITMEQIASYNGDKHEIALKFQKTTSREGLILQAVGLLGGRRHDWAVYVRGGIEQQLKKVCKV